MAWDRVERNWKQFIGNSRKRSGANSPTMTLLPSTDAATSLRAKSKSTMGLRRSRSARMSMTGLACFHDCCGVGCLRCVRVLASLAFA